MGQSSSAPAHTQGQGRDPANAITAEQDPTLGGDPGRSDRPTSITRTPLNGTSVAAEMTHQGALSGGSSSSMTSARETPCAGHTPGTQASLGARSNFLRTQPQPPLDCGEELSYSELGSCSLSVPSLTRYGFQWEVRTEFSGRSRSSQGCPLRPSRHHAEHGTIWPGL